MRIVRAILFCTYGAQKWEIIAAGRKKWDKRLKMRHFPGVRFFDRFGCPVRGESTASQVS